MPFSLTWPAKYREEIEINLPQEWGAEEGSDTIKSTSFSMSARFLHDGRKTIFLEYTYESLKDHVDPDDIKKYVETLEKRDKLSYVLSYSEDNKTISSSTRKHHRNSMNWPLCQFACFANDWRDHLVDDEKVIFSLQPLYLLLCSTCCLAEAFSRGVDLMFIRSIAKNDFCWQFLHSIQDFMTGCLMMIMLIFYHFFIK